MNASVVERLGVLSSAPWFDQAIASDLLRLVGMAQEDAEAYVWSLRGAGVTVERDQVSRIAEPLRTEMRQSLHSQKDNLYRDALAVFAQHALNGSGPALASVMGDRGTRMSAHALACVAERQSGQWLTQLIGVVQEPTERFESDAARDIATLLDAYAFGRDRSSEFFTGLSLWTQGRRIEAQPHFELVLSHDVVDKAAGIAGHLLGAAKASSGDLVGAREQLRAALTVLRAIEDTSGLILTLTTLGRVTREEFRAAGDVGSLEESLEALREARDLTPEMSQARGKVLQALALSLAESGDPEALQVAEEAVELLPDGDDKVSALTNLALMYRDADEPELYGERLAQAIAMAERLDLKGMELARLLNVQAGFERRAGQWTPALAHARLSLATGKRAGDKRHIAHASHTLAAIGTDQLEFGEESPMTISEVERLLSEARTILVRLRDSRGVNMVDRTRARLASVMDTRSEE